MIYKSEKQIQNEKDELIKELRKSNCEMLQTLIDLVDYDVIKDSELHNKAKQLIQKATTPCETK